MQSLDVISVNFWQIIISLLNLLLLFLIIKKFLFGPVKNVLQKRQQEIDEKYELAEQANADAQENKEKWEEKLNDAKDEADSILKTATMNASKRSDKIIAEAKDKADSIMRQAENDIILERKKSEDSIKKEIVDVSAALTEKMLNREINENDHRAIIDSFIKEIGDNDGGNK